MESAFRDKSGNDQGQTLGKSPSFSLCAAMCSEFGGLKITSILIYGKVSGREGKHSGEELATICGGQHYHNI